MRRWLMIFEISFLGIIVTLGAKANVFWSNMETFCHMTHPRKHYSHPFLPATPSSPSRTLEVLFELTRRPSWTLDSPRALLTELQRYKDTFRCAVLGAEVPGHRQKQLTHTLCVCWKGTFLRRSLIVKSQQNIIELVTKPGGATASEGTLRCGDRIRAVNGISMGRCGQ